MTGIDPAKAAAVARRGATRLMRLTGLDGRFIYRYERADGPAPSRSYNALRHCGAAWSMLATAGALGEMSAVSEAARRSIDYLIEQHISPFNDQGASCILDKGKSKLGGAGLAILALAEAYQPRREARFIDLACALGRYIVAEQMPDGDFVHSRIHKTGEERDFRSDYYTGEALFGLVRLFELTGDEHWLDRVAFSEEKLAATEYGVDVQSHWMLYALDALDAARPSDIYLEHARKIAAAIVTNRGYRDDGRSTPIACRSEGLLAYVRLLNRRGVDTLFPSVPVCLVEIRENLERQLGCMTPTGEFVRGGGSDEVRIDYIQHNISSFLSFSLLPESVVANGSATTSKRTSVSESVD